MQKIHKNKKWDCVRSQGKDKITCIIPYNYKVTYYRGKNAVHHYCLRARFFKILLTLAHSTSQPVTYFLLQESQDYRSPDGTTSFPHHPPILTFQCKTEVPKAVNILHESPESVIFLTDKKNMEN